MTSAELRSGSDSLRGRPYVSIAEFPFARRRASPAEEASVERPSATLRARDCVPLFSSRQILQLRYALAVAAIVLGWSCFGCV